MVRTVQVCRIRFAVETIDLISHCLNRAGVILTKNRGSLTDQRGRELIPVLSGKIQSAPVQTRKKRRLPRRRVRVMRYGKP